MLMPEASVHEYDLPQTGKDKIWSAGEITSMESETVSQTVCYSPHGQFGLRVQLADTPHVGAAFLGRESISHPTEPAPPEFAGLRATAFINSSIRAAMRCAGSRSCSIVQSAA